MSKAQIDWYGKKVALAVGWLTDEALTQLAFQGEGIAKTGAPVDTGFMRNAIYAVGPHGSHRATAEADAAGALAGTAVARGLAGAVEVGEHEAAIHGAAEYTAYQELRVGFMYAALEALQAIAPGLVEEVAKDVLHD